MVARHPLHALAARQRFVQHCGPHVHRQYPRLWRNGARGRRRMRADRHADFVVRLSRRHRRLAAREHQARRGQGSRREKGRGKLLRLSPRALRARHDSGLHLPPPDPHHLRRLRGAVPLRRIVLFDLPARHGLCTDRDGYEPVHHHAGLQQKRHALRSDRRGRKHHPRPDFHLRL